MQNPYEILGVAPSASDKQIRDVYRKLAKKYHPDLNPGNPQAEERFKQINEAYEQVSAPEKRASINCSPFEQHSYGFHSRSDKNSAGRFGQQEDLEDLFKQFFSQRSNNGLRAHLTLDFLEAVNGSHKHIFLSNGRRLAVVVPPGAEDGQVIRVEDPGASSDQKPARVYVTLRVRPHKYFTRKGVNLYLDFPTTVYEAILGRPISVPTPTGLVKLTLPNGSNTGSVVRLRGRGVPSIGRHGDLYVRIKIMLPEQSSPAMENLIRAWAAEHPYDPRPELTQMDKRHKT